ncbi:hypothetical protein D3C81_2063230 [compost metagenome]
MGTGCRVVEGDPAVVGQLVQRICVVERFTDELLLGVEDVRLGRSTQQAEGQAEGESKLSETGHVRLLHG